MVGAVKGLMLTTAVFSFMIGATSVRTLAAEMHSQEVVRQGSNIFVSFIYKKGMEMHLEIGRFGIKGLGNIKSLYGERE